MGERGERRERGERERVRNIPLVQDDKKGFPSKDCFVLKY